MPWQDQEVLDHLKETEDLESEFKLERDKIHTKKFKDKLDMDRIKHIDTNLQDITHIRTSIIDNNPGVYEAYAAKYKTLPVKEEPEAEGTSPLAGLLRGTKDTLKFAGQHPTRAAAHAGIGVESLASLPARGLETAIMGEKGEFPFASPKKWLRGREEEAKAKDIEAGVNTEGAGPGVAEAVGGMTVPVGPTMQAGKHLKNILKGAGFAGGISAGEEAATKGDVTTQQTGTAAGFGGAVTGALSALLSRGKVKAPLTKEPIDVTPKAIEGPPKAGEVKGDVIYGEAPPGGIAGEGTPVAGKPTPKQGAEAATPTRPPITHRPPEDAEVVPPIARGLKEMLKPTPPGLSPRGQAALAGIGPEARAGLSAEVSPNVLPVAKEPGALAKVMRPRPIETLEPPGAPSQKELYGETSIPEAKAPVKAPVKESKIISPEEAVKMAKDMDAQKSTMEAEATLRDVISGKTDPNTLPMKRGSKKAPKSEAPVAAEEGETGALTEVDFFGEGKPIKRAPAEFKGVQKGIGEIKDFELYNLTADIPGHPKGSTISRETLEAKGYVVPKRPIASSKIAGSQPIKEVPSEKPRVELQSKRTEDFIKEQGYQVREREPFPGQKEYDLIDPKSGNVVARGDRQQLTHALGNRPEAKGFKLHSFPAGVEDFVPVFRDKIRKMGGRVPDDVTIENNPHRAGVANTLLRPFETPEFNVRKSEAGRTITDAGREADRQIQRRVRDLITEERVPGKEYHPTKLSGYFSASSDIRDRINKVLVLGDKHSVTYTPEQLIKHGLTTDEVSMYQGVREALDKVVKWVKEIGPEYAEFDSRKIEGYIPRVWKGDWEIYVNGNKYLKPKTETSSFSTLSEAAAEAHTIKAGAKDAKVSIKFFPDPEYLSSRGLADARAIARLKKNLESMGHMDSKAIDDAFGMGKSVKGFAKHLLERKDATGYETQNLDMVLNSYFHQAARRVEMQKVKSVAEAVLKDHKADLSAGQVQYMQEYVERVAGKPAWDQIAIHSFVQDTPIGKWIDPIRGGKLIQSGRDLVTHLTLGFGNVGWAMINLDGLTRHVWPLLAAEAKRVGATSHIASERYMMHGMKEFFTNKGLRQQLAHHGVIDIQLMSEPKPDIGHKYGAGNWTPERISMILGTATEEFSRGVAAIARYQMALDHGAKPAAAMQDAARFVEQTLGRYSRGGRPPVYTGAIGSTVGLFKTYMSVMLQNGWRAFESKDPGTIARYITGAVGVSGVLGLVPGIEDMDSAITKQSGWSPIESIEKNLPPAVATGLFSIAGVDLSRKAGIPEIIPDNARGWAGPVIGRFASAISDVANGEYGEAGLDLLPNSIRNVIAVARGYNEGKVIGRLDKPTYSVNRTEAALHAVGLTPSNEAQDSRLYQRNLNKEAYRDNELGHLTRRIASGRASDSDYTRFAELGGKSKRIKNERQRQNQTLVERQYKHLPKILRREQETQ